MNKETTKVTNEPVGEVKETIIPETPTEPKGKRQTLKPVTGTVIGDLKLNVREEPSLKGKVLCTIPVGAKAKIDTESSTNGWYKVQTKEGVNGFCMKKYIATK